MLHKLNDLVCVKVISRPSKVCKTPYVADIELENGEKKEEIITKKV